MTENKHTPAFPIVESGTRNESISLGLSKREWLAGMAIQGLLANPQLINPSTATNTTWREDISRTATMVADALLAKLSKY